MSMQHYKVALLINILSLAQGQIDRTLENSTGCEVTRSAVNKVTSDPFWGNCLSNIEHNYLLLRVAYVSDFGESTAIAGSDRHGIWMLSEQNLIDVLRHGLFDDSCIFQATKRKVAFKGDDRSAAALYKPWIGAIIASFLLRIHSSTSGQVVPSRSDAEGQLNFWLSATGMANTSALATKFREGAEHMDGPNANPCLVCRDYQTDLVFAIDDSSSITAAEWILQIGFIKKVLASYNESLAQGTTQNALVIFHYFAAPVYGYDTKNLSDVLDAYSRQESATNIAAALSAVADIIHNDTLSRKDDQAVRKLVFVLTDGINNRGDMNKGVADINTVKDFSDVFAIGMKSEANQTQLLLIASRPELMRIYSTMEQFSADIADIIYKSCKARTPVDVQDQALLSFLAFQSGQRRSFVLEYTNGTDIYVRVSVSGTTPKENGLTYVFYISETQPYPSESDYDQKFTRQPDGSFDGFQISLKTISRARRSAENATLLVYLTIETPSDQTCLDCTEDIELVLDVSAQQNEQIKLEVQKKNKDPALMIGLGVGLPLTFLVAVVSVGVFVVFKIKAKKNQIAPEQQ